MSGFMTRRRFLALACATASAALVPLDASASPQDLVRTKAAMSTLVSVTVARAPASLAEDAAGRAFAEMDRLVRIFDRRDPSAALHVLNDAGSLRLPPPELFEALCRAMYMRSLTRAAFEPGVAPLVDMLAAGAGESELSEAAALADSSKTSLSRERIALAGPGRALTLDGAAKGYIVDAMAETLERAGVESYLVNAGGDVRAKGSPSGTRPWRVGVQDPAGGPPAAVMEMRSGAAATSGLYARGPHLLSAKGKPATALFPSVTATAATAVEADALSTALMVMGPRAGLELADFLPGRECLFLDAAGRETASRGFGAS